MPMGIAVGRVDPLTELRPLVQLSTEAMQETSRYGWDEAQRATYWPAYDTLDLALASGDGRIMARGPSITDWSSLGWTAACEIAAQRLAEVFWKVWRRVWNPRR